MSVSIEQGGSNTLRIVAPIAILGFTGSGVDTAQPQG